MDTTPVCKGFGTSSACGECEFVLHMFNVGMLTRQDLCKVVRKFLVVAKEGTLLSLLQLTLDCNCEIIDIVHDGGPPTINNIISYIEPTFSIWLDVQKQLYINEDTKSKRNDINACSEFLEEMKSYTSFQDLFCGLSQLNGKPYGRTHTENFKRVLEADRVIDHAFEWTFQRGCKRHADTWEDIATTLP